MEPSTRTPDRPLAVVTGASTGIGYELAREFAEHGFDLVVAAEDDGIVTSARELEKLGAWVRNVQVDLSVPQRLCEALHERLRCAVYGLRSSRAPVSR